MNSLTLSLKVTNALVSDNNNDKSSVPMYHEIKKKGWMELRNGWNYGLQQYEDSFMRCKWISEHHGNSKASLHLMICMRVESKYYCSGFL